MIDEPNSGLAAFKRELVFENAGAKLWDIGDGALAFEHRTKMNIYDEQVFDAIGAAIDAVPRGFRVLVVGSDHPRTFSCGADLGYFLGRMKAGDYAALDHFLRYGQERFLALKYAPFPVVAAAFGLALGGGCETLLHMDEVVAHTDLRAGVPESTLGILPGWGGCTQLLIRALQTNEADALRKPFSFILAGRFGGSAQDAREAGVLRPSDPIVMDRAHLIARAKARAVALAERYRPPAPTTLFLPGPPGKAALMAQAKGEAGLSDNDLVVADALATILSGGATDLQTPLSERDVMTLEREATLALARSPATFARIEHMLAVGKPLRN